MSKRTGNDGQSGPERFTLSQSFLNEINKHGYPLQHSLARAVRGSRDAGQHRWSVTDLEFPVVVKGRPYHIDIVLEWPTRNRVLAVECKRVQPKFGKWTFAADRSIWRRSGGRPIRLEQLRIEPRMSVTAGCLLREMSCEIADLGLEVKVGTAEGDGAPVGSSGRGAIDDALDQAMRGMNGLINLLAERNERSQITLEYIVVPVVVTTAELYLHHSDISGADLSTGNLAAEPNEPRAVPWLAIEKVISPGIKHDWTAVGNKDASVRERADWSRMASGEGLADETFRDYRRSAFVVHAPKFIEFLASMERELGP